MICDPDGHPHLTQFSEEGFVDLCFRIIDVVEDDEYLRLQLAASHEETKVGLTVFVRRGIREGFTSAMNLVKGNVVRDGVLFQRAGVESDRLLTILGRLYDTDIAPERIVDRFSFTAIALHNEPFDLRTELTRIKCFGCDSDAEVARDEYFESFVNIDLPNRLAFWNEKDPDYRAPLMRALAFDAS